MGMCTFSPHCLASLPHRLPMRGLQEKPGLRLMQYKSMIFERWQRDPRNPRNQKVDA